MGTALTVAAAVAAHRDEIRAIVEANRATNPRVFGSVARGEDTPHSDLDLLVDPRPGMTLLTRLASSERLRNSSESMWTWSPPAPEPTASGQQCSHRPCPCDGSRDWRSVVGKT